MTNRKFIEIKSSERERNENINIVNERKINIKKAYECSIYK